MSAGSSRHLTKRISQNVPEETQQDWEHHMVLRLPSDAAKEVKEYLNGDESKKLAVSFTHSNMRQAHLRIGEKELAATVRDLPCIVEVQKTLDRKATYKIADISQIMIASNETPLPDETQPSLSSEATNKKELRKWQHLHGLTPPMKSARQRRFRKTKKKKFMDVPEVELELKRLLRADQEADSIRWEVIAVEDKTKDVKKFDVLGDVSSSSEDETPTSRTEDRE